MRYFGFAALIVATLALAASGQTTQNKRDASSLTVQSECEYQCRDATGADTNEC